jgi:hypothetical protein
MIIAELSSLRFRSSSDTLLYNTYFEATYALPLVRTEVINLQNTSHFIAGLH